MLLQLYLWRYYFKFWAHFPVKTMTHRIKSKGKLPSGSWHAAPHLLFCSPLSRSLHRGHRSRARCFSNTPADFDPIFLYLEYPPNNREYQCLNSHVLSCNGSVHIPPPASFLCPSENQPLIISISLTNDDNNGDEECQRNLIKMCLKFSYEDENERNEGNATLYQRKKMPCY